MEKLKPDHNINYHISSIIRIIQLNITKLSPNGHKINRDPKSIELRNIKLELKSIRDKLSKYEHE